MSDPSTTPRPASVADAPDGAEIDLSGLPAAARADLPRAHHYGEFYGLKPIPDTDPPLLLVHGNCQAESLRLLLQGAPSAPCVSVRLPPLHEIAADEVPFLERLLERCEILITQPVSGGYHGLPLGTDDVRRTARRAQMVVVPIIRFVGLYPYQVVTNSTDLQPPVVPYHDLRTVVRAAGMAPLPALRREHLEAVTTWSVAALARREEAAGAVAVHDLLRPAGVRAANVANHPGNPVLVGLARRVQERLGWPETATDPGFELLDSIHAPLEEAVCDAVDPQADVRRHWVVAGEHIDAETLSAAQYAWYQTRPDVVAFVLSRAAEQLEAVGATTAGSRGPSSGG